LRTCPAEVEQECRRDRDGWADRRNHTKGAGPEGSLVSVGVRRGMLPGAAGTPGATGFSGGAGACGGTGFSFSAEQRCPAAPGPAAGQPPGTLSGPPRTRVTRSGHGPVGDSDVNTARLSRHEGGRFEVEVTDGEGSIFALRYGTTAVVLATLTIRMLPAGRPPRRPTASPAQARPGGWFPGSSWRNSRVGSQAGREPAASLIFTSGFCLRKAATSRSTS
jgi:hypothetical protein